MKKTNSVNKDLFQLKLAVVMHHKGEHNEYLRQSIARDACYSSNNSIQYKTQQMSDLRLEIVSLAPAEGTEIVDVKLAKKVDIFQRMNDELLELTERFDADKAVYKAVTDEEWKPYKKSSSKDVSQVLNAVNDILGKDFKPVQETI